MPSKAKCKVGWKAMGYKSMSDCASYGKKKMTQNDQDILLSNPHLRNFKGENILMSYVASRSANFNFFTELLSYGHEIIDDDKDKKRMFKRIL